MSIDPYGHEVISACENICRDFSWLGPWVPALLASATALLIAFVAYPYQKNKDRELQVSGEKRSAYQRFFEAAEKYFAILRAAAFDEKVDLPSDEFGALEAAKTELAFRGGENGVRSCSEFAQHLKDYRKYVKLCREANDGPTEATKQARDAAYHEANQARVRAIIAARNDAGTLAEDSASENTVRRLFMMNASEKNT